MDIRFFSIAIINCDLHKLDGTDSHFALDGTLEVLTNNFVEPFVLGGSTGLSPLAVIVSAMFWTWLWGPIGLLLATPLSPRLDGFKFEQKHSRLYRGKPEGWASIAPQRQNHPFSVAPQSEENEEPDWDCPCKSGAVYQALSGRDQLLHQVTPQPMN